MTFFTRGLTLFVLAAVVGAPAQKTSLNERHEKNNVIYLAEPVTVEAGKPTDVEAYFRVADGLHINSHVPDPEMIPTTLMLQPVAGVKVGKMQYPVGMKYAFSFAPSKKLSVYNGDFVVKAHLTAEHVGSYTLNGLLDYQACDNLKCYPVKTLPIVLILTAK
jgi:hypothetical protein